MKSDTCSTCIKRGTKTCAMVKEIGARPGDGDWCTAWKKRKDEPVRVEKV